MCLLQKKQFFYSPAYQNREKCERKCSSITFKCPFICTSLECVVLQINSTINPLIMDKILIQYQNPFSENLPNFNIDGGQ